MKLTHDKFICNLQTSYNDVQSSNFDTLHIHFFTYYNQLDKI